MSSDERLGAPRTNQEPFDLLARRWIGEPLSRSLRPAAGLRNILVHGYASVDKRIVRDVLVNRLNDLIQFVDAVDVELRSALGSRLRVVSRRPSATDPT